MNGNYIELSLGHDEKCKSFGLTSLMMHCTNILTHQLIFLKKLALRSTHMYYLSQEISVLCLHLSFSIFLKNIFFFSQEIGVLRQQILASEGELRSVSSPAYTAKNRDKAMAEQSVSF